MTIKCQMIAYQKTLLMHCLMRATYPISKFVKQFLGQLNAKGNEFISLTLGNITKGSIMVRKAQFGYYALVIILAITSLRFSQMMWQQHQTLSHLHTQTKQLKHQKVKQVLAKSTIDKSSNTNAQFFNLAYNWSSGSEYQKRVKKINQARVVTIILDTTLKLSLFRNGLIMLFFENR